MRKDKLFIISISLIIAGILCSCAVRPKPADPIEFYTLDYEVPAFEDVSPLPVALSVEKFSTTPPYNTERIIFSKDRYFQNKYYYHRWIANPEDIITPLLARDMIASNRFQAVMVSCDYFTNYQLTGTIDEFYEKDTGNGWDAVISMTVTLINKEATDETKRIMFQKTYKKIQPMARKNPKSLASAMSTALSEISRQVIADVYLAIQQIPA